VESDAVAESSFEDGDSAKYKVIIDTNTSVMNEELLEDIEEYVRQGGVFVTFVESGRHTPESPNSWPISKLTGFRVSEINLKNSGMIPVEEEGVFHGDWLNVKANGLSLQRVSPEAHPLMLWEDGSVAIGVRPLGKGYIVQMGCKFDGMKMADRLEPREKGFPEKVIQFRRLLTQLLEWQGIDLIDYQWSPEDQYVLLRHFVSNSGLYDVWTVWNQNKESSTTGRIELPKSHNVSWVYDLIGGERIELEADAISVELAPLQTRVFLTPRLEITKAPARWFELQRNWWRGIVEPEIVEYDEPLHPNSVDLGKEWKIYPLNGSEFESGMLATDYDDSEWGELEMLGIWSTIPEYKEVNHALLRKRFTVPEEWTDGFVEMGLHSWWLSTFVTKGRIWLDGQLVQDWSANGIVNANPFGALTPGSEHVLAVEIQSDSVLAGSRGTAWLWHQRAPEETIDLSGLWEPSEDSLRYGEPVQLPGHYEAMTLRRDVYIPESLEGTRVRVAAEDIGGIDGVMVNGYWVMRFHHQIEDRFELDVTPWVRFGETNRIEFFNRQYSARGELRFVELKFYKKLH
ncbi:MAG: hypothetical protein ACQKBT_08495, partial [Puniceicoccales bacterium]